MRHGCLILLPIVLFTLACANPSEPSRNVSSISISGVAPSVGQSAQFVANATFSDGTVRPLSTGVAWATSNALVATVSSAGLVTATSAGTAEISAEYRGVVGRTTITVSVDNTTADYIESLFLGSGALAARTTSIGCPRFGLWPTFPSGTVVRIRTSSLLTTAIVNALTAAAAQIPDASSGKLSVQIEPANEENPTPALNEVTVTVSANAQGLGCPLAQGCTIFQFSGVNTFSARSILATAQPPAAYVHDAIGHGVLGLCHVDGNLIGGPGRSLMSFGTNIFSNQIAVQLTSSDLAATRPVFFLLLPGSNFSDFARAGLIRGSSVTSSIHRHSLPSGTATVVIDAPPIGRD